MAGRSTILQRQQRRERRREFQRGIEQRGICDVYAVSSSCIRGNAARSVIGAGAASSSNRCSVRESPSTVDGNSSRCRSRAAARYGNADVSVRRKASIDVGSGERNAAHAPTATAYCAAVTGWRSLEQRTELARRELAETLESRTAGKRADANQAHRLWPGPGNRKPAEDLNQVQLVEKIVLVPQHDLVVGVVVVDDLAPPPQPSNVRLDTVFFAGQMSRNGSPGALRLKRQRAPDRRGADRPRWTTGLEYPHRGSFRSLTCRSRREERLAGAGQARALVGHLLRCEVKCAWRYVRLRA